MRKAPSGLVAITLVVAALGAAGGSAALAQTTTFQGPYDIPYFAEAGTATLVVDPAVPELTLSTSGMTIFGIPIPIGLSIPMAGMPIVGGTRFEASGMALLGGTLTIDVLDTGVIQVTAFDMPGFGFGPSFSGMGTITDPTLMAAVNDISITFTADPSKMIPPPNDQGTLNARAMIMAAPILPLPALTMLALLLAGLGVWRITRRSATAA